MLQNINVWGCRGLRVHSKTSEKKNTRDIVDRSVVSYFGAVLSFSISNDQRIIYSRI